MQPTELGHLVKSAACRVCGWEDAAQPTQRRVLAQLIRDCKSADCLILCEPSLARSSQRPPDVVLIDPVAGLHVIEVKGHDLAGIAAIEAGGLLRLRYASGVRSRNPIAQVRAAMFDIKNATEQACTGDLQLPFRYWVVFPRIQRAEWLERWGPQGFCPPELLFADDLAGFAQRLQELGQQRLQNAGLVRWPADQLAAVGRAFGDSSVLYPRVSERLSRATVEGTWGEMFDQAAAGYKELSRDQQLLSEQNWGEGPRLIRGVAGSGKTIVLANNLARRLQRLSAQPGLFATPPERLLALCNNRSLVPLLRKKISLAYQQRTGLDVPAQRLDVISYNRLLYQLSLHGLWRYQKIEEGTDAERSQRYLQELRDARQTDPERVETLSYDAIYIDEGQDFQETDFCLLQELCRVAPGQEPNLYIFYDDAQNLLGRKRPNWQSLGLSLRGKRSWVMTHCFRNTCPIVEAAFNVLYGTCATQSGDVPNREFGDLATLEEKHAIAREDDGFWRVGFAVRDGLPPRLTVTTSPARETQTLFARLQWLIGEQGVRPQDILVLALARSRIEGLAEYLAQNPIPGVTGVHVAFHAQDELLGQPGVLTLSTTASAKGYDAYCVLLASANEFPSDVTGRISFYVGCTRAIEYLEVFGYREEGLVAELARVLQRQQGFSDTSH
ncbi:MAG: hypothetical protein U0935_09695 [Pirellulales bacterium]